MGKKKNKGKEIEENKGHKKDDYLDHDVVEECSCGSSVRARSEAFVREWREHHLHAGRVSRTGGTSETTIGFLVERE